MNKAIRRGIVLAAFAAFLVAPSLALAVNEATVTHPTGTTAATPLNIIGTNKETNGTYVISTLTDGNQNILAQCTTATLTGTLTKNTHAAVEAEITSADFTGTPGVVPHTTHCASSFGTITVTTNPATNGLPWCLRSTNTMASDEVQVRGGKCSEAARPIRFILHSSVAGECTYQRTPAVIGKYTTHPEDAIIHVEKQEFPLIAGGIFCPTKGFLDLTQRLSAETTSGVETGLWIDKIS